MKRTPGRTFATSRIRKLLAGDGTSIPLTLPIALQGQAGRNGESIFTMALRWATPVSGVRVERVTGPQDVGFFIDLYKHTENPLWLWMGLALTKNPGDIPPEIFRYLKEVADRFSQGVTDQVQHLNQVRITPGKEFGEAFEALKSKPPPSPDIPAALKLSSPGRSLFQALARDLQALSMAAAVDDLISREGCSQEDAHKFLAQAVGRISPEAGPAMEAIRKIVDRGRKLLRHRRTETSAQSVHSGVST